MSGKAKKDTKKTITYDGISKVGIVVSQWNLEITSNLLKACRQSLADNGVGDAHIKVLEVPGAYELALGARWLLSDFQADAVICLGCVIKGETHHDVYISQAVSTGLLHLSLTSNKPIIFGVLTPNNMQQAIERSGGQYGNKGEEAALTALSMLELKKSLKGEKKKIGFGS